MQEDMRQSRSGSFFSLDHSTVVVPASVTTAVTGTAFKERFAVFQSVGRVIGTPVSTPS